MGSAAKLEREKRKRKEITLRRINDLFFMGVLRSEDLKHWTSIAGFSSEIQSKQATLVVRLPDSPHYDPPAP